MEEIWKPVVGYEERYLVSNKGRVKSLSYKGIKNRELILKFICRGNEYLSVTLYKNKIGKMFFVHRIVMTAFCGFSTLQVDHVNGIKTDNNLSNLEYVNARENVSRGFKRQNTSSKHTGVSWHKHSSTWNARIEINGKVHFLGRFSDELLAANAYNQKLKEVSNGF